MLVPVELVLDLARGDVPDAQRLLTRTRGVSTTATTPLDRVAGRGRTWSFEQLASWVPLSLGSTLRTHSVCPLSVLTQYPVATSHTRIVWSREQVTSVSPDGIKCTAEML